MLPKEAEARRKIRTATRPQIREMRRTIRLALWLAPEGTFTITNTRGIDRAVFTLTLALYTKALKTVRAIHVVCETGLDIF